MTTYYWHLFRHSILATGQQYLRCSTRSLQNGVIKSAYNQARAEKSNRPVSLRSVREALSDLEQIGAIRKEGEPTRDGTLYKVLIPEEIEACRKAMSAREASLYRRVDVRIEVDYYNVRENRHKIFERDGYKCAYCRKQLTRFTATLDHMKPVSAGGNNGYENVITACLGCNSTKTGKSLADFLADRGAAAATPAQPRDGETVT